MDWGPTSITLGDLSPRLIMGFTHLYGKPANYRDCYTTIHEYGPFDLKHCQPKHPDDIKIFSKPLPFSRPESGSQTATPGKSILKPLFGVYVYGLDNEHKSIKCQLFCYYFQHCLEHNYESYV